MITLPPTGAACSSFCCFAGRGSAIGAEFSARRQWRRRRRQRRRGRLDLDSLVGVSHSRGKCCGAMRGPREAYQAGDREGSRRASGRGRGGTCSAIRQVERAGGIAANAPNRTLHMHAGGGHEQSAARQKNSSNFGISPPITVGLPVCWRRLWRTHALARVSTAALRRLSAAQRTLKPSTWRLTPLRSLGAALQGRCTSVPPPPRPPSFFSGSHEAGRECASLPVQGGLPGADCSGDGPEEREILGGGTRCMMQQQPACFPSCRSRVGSHASSACSTRSCLPP